MPKRPKNYKKRKKIYSIKVFKVVKVLNVPNIFKVAGESVQLQVFVGVADGGEELRELAVGNHDRSPIVVGMECERRRIAQIGVEEQMNVIFGIVYQPERRNRPGRNPRYRSMRCSDANDSLP